MATTGSGGNQASPAKVLADDYITLLIINSFRRLVNELPVPGKPSP
jgi:hypothetical protein